LSVPAPTESITPEWLTDVLTSAGIIAESEVTSVTRTIVGEKQAFFGTLLRLDVSYSQPEGAPNTFVAKLSPEIPEIPHANKREVAFYEQIAAGRDLPVPRCYHSAFDPATGTSLLLLEDFTHLNTVDFITGCTPDDAESAVAGLAAIHANLWSDSTLDKADWAFSLADLPFDQLWEQYPDKIGDLLPGFSIEGSFTELGDLIADRLPTLLDRLESPPATWIHRDPHIDNLLFGDSQLQPPITIVDWQFVGRGKGALDVGYLLISSLPHHERRQSEGRIIETYHDLLVEAGAVDYSIDDCWTDYRLSAVAKLVITVAATVLLDNTDHHRRAWRTADLQRLIAFTEDHRPHQLLE
jgi:aminoglycoside/choline kinase family phosphotransferase